MSHQKSEEFIEEARLLLPWYLTNTLSDEEQQHVNEALEASADLRKEFVREEKLMQLVKENTSLLELSALDTTEQRLENTLARIEREEQQEAAVALQTSDAPETESIHVPATAKAENSWFSRFFKQKLFDIDWLTPANAAFASLLAVQVGVLGYHQMSPSEPETVYSTVTVGDHQSNNGLNKQFLMEFQVGAQHGEVCDFLNELGASIIEGPNSRNMFVVEMPTAPYTDAEALADSIMSKAESSPIVFIGPKFQN